MRHACYSFDWNMAESISSLFFQTQLVVFPPLSSFLPPLGFLYPASMISGLPVSLLSYGRAIYMSLYITSSAWCPRVKVIPSLK